MINIKKTEEKSNINIVQYLVSRKEIGDGSSIYDLAKYLASEKEIPNRWKYCTLKQYFTSNLIDKIQILDYMKNEEKFKVYIHKLIIMYFIKTNNIGKHVKEIEIYTSLYKFCKKRMPCFRNGHIQIPQIWKRINIIDIFEIDGEGKEKVFNYVYDINVENRIITPRLLSSILFCELVRFIGKSIISKKIVYTYEDIVRIALTFNGSAYIYLCSIIKDTEHYKKYKYV